MAKIKRVHNRVKVAACNGSLRLQFPKPLVDSLKGQGINFARYRSLGKREVDPITGKPNYPWAESVASRIQADLDHPDGLFDYTLAKYLSIKIVDEEGNSTLLTTTAILTIGKLWDDYLDYHTPTLKQSTVNHYQKDCGSKINPYRDLAISLDTANLIRTDFLKQQNDTVKKALSLLENAVDWAITQDKVKLLKNPFNGLSKLIKIKKRKNKLTGLPDDFVAFSETEVRVILDAFAKDVYRSKYYPFLRFKFMTGCRTGEAIALTWEDVKFQQGVILFNKTYGKTGVSQGTKTEDYRTFPMNDELVDWLQSLKESSSSDLVFPSDSGGYLPRSSVGTVWGAKSDTTRKSGTVVTLAIDGKIAQYLPLYNTRHTFINACIDKGVDTVTIADWCGNSDSIIEKVYRSRNRNIDINKQMPSF